MALALAKYHPKLREGVLGDVPDTADDKAFLADGTLSETEIAALDRAQSVFGMETFYQAWELDELTPNEVHAVLYMLTFYDPYTTVHDVTANPDDPEAEGAEITRTLDDFGVYPGMCLYCRQKADQPIAEFDEPVAAIFKLIRRMTLQHLAHHAKVQADALSPCDLRDFTEEDLIALGFVEFPHIYSYPISHSVPYPYFTLAHSITASVRLTSEQLRFEKDFPRRPYGRTSKVLVQPGEILSPFTHAVRAAGGPPSERGMGPCLEAAKRIVDWDIKRYDHFDEYFKHLHGKEREPLLTYFDVIFPEARSLNDEVGITYHPHNTHPTWAWFLVDESGGEDKSKRLMNQFRALNLPAIRQGKGIYVEKSAAKAMIATVAQEKVRRALLSNRVVLVSPFDLHLHRNIGFSEFRDQTSVDDLFRLFSFPEHCGIERLRPGVVEGGVIEGDGENIRWHSSDIYLSWSQDISYSLWKRERGLPPDLYWNSGMSFWNREYGLSLNVAWNKRPLMIILEYACE